MMLLGFIFILVLSIFLFLIQKNKTFKGWFYEILLFYIIKRKLPIDAKIYKNIYLPNRRTNFTNEFDLIILSKKGIVIIELKNWIGDIYLSKQKATVYIKGKKSERYSPIAQNNTKINTLMDCLEIKNKNNIYSLIGFSGLANSIKSNYSNIYIGNSIVEPILNYTLSGQDVFDDEEYIRLRTLLDYIEKNVSKDVKKNHIKNIKKRNLYK